MEPNKNKDLDRILRKAMNASKAEQTTCDFTENVMSKIEATETKKITHSPIISNKKWIMIALFVTTLIAGVFLFEVEYPSTYLDSTTELIKIDFSFLKFLSNFNISDVFMYAVLLFGLLFGIQILLIKYYYFRLNPTHETER